MPTSDAVHDTDQVIDQSTDAQDLESREPSAPRSSSGSDKPDHTVPLSALIAERRHYQQKLDDLQRQLAELQRGRQDSKEPADERERLERQWREFLKLDKLESSVEEIKKKVDPIAESINAIQDLYLGAQLAVQQYIGGVTAYVHSKYDDSLPVSKLAFEKMVAAELTPHERDAVMAGDVHAIDPVVERVMKDLRRDTVAIRRAKELDKVRQLPKTPAPGGVPAEREEEEPLSGKALHDAAWETFQSALRRNKGGGA